MGILSTFSILAVGINSLILPLPSATLSANNQFQSPKQHVFLASKPLHNSPPVPSPTPKSTPQPSETPEPTSSATPATDIKPSSPAVLSDAQIEFLGHCESGMTADRNSGNGFYGAFQFTIGTWNSMGTGYERADMAPLDVQKDAVQRLVARSSIFTQFPGCSRQMLAQGLL